MGIARNVLLGSLVGLMMILAFAIGIVPSQNLLRASAASGDSGQIEMANLLDAVLGLEQKAATTIGVTYPLEGSRLFVPTDTDAVSMTVRAEADGDASPVIFGTEGQYDNANQVWVGNVYSGVATSQGPFLGSYFAGIDLSPFLTGAVTGANAVIGIYSMYAFGMASFAKAATAQIEYELYSNGVPNTGTTYTFTEVGPDVDADKNALPDSLDAADFLEAGDVWYATYGGRQVAVANLDPGTVDGKTAPTEVIVSPDPSVTVYAPTSAQLVANGVIAQGSKAVLVVSVFNSLIAALDEYEGSASGLALAQWALLVSGKQPSGGLVDGGRYVEVSIVSVDGCGLGHCEIDTLPDPLTVEIELRGLTIPEMGATVWSFPTSIEMSGGVPIFANAGDDAATSWDWVATRQPTVPGLATDAIIVETSTLSIFAPFKSMMRLDSAVPNEGPTGEETFVQLNGDFGTAGSLAAEAAAAAFYVYFDDMPARVVGLDAAKVAAALKVYAPAKPTPGIVDVSVVDAFNRNNQAVLGNGFTYFTPQMTITAVDPNRGAVLESIPVAIYGDFGVKTPMDATQAKQELLVEFGSLRATIMPPGIEVTKAGNIVHVNSPAAATPGAVTVRVAKVANPSNMVELLSGYTYLYRLTTQTQGSGAVQADPASADGLYGASANVELTAVPAAGSVFVRWEGDLAGSANPQTINMNDNKTVTAVFVPERTLTVNVDGQGTVTLDPVGGVYADGTVVTLTAEPEDGWTFSQWQGDALGADPTVQVTMNADKTVTAVFVEEVVPRTLTVNVQGNGTVVADPLGNPTYDNGTVVTLTATPDDGWEFQQWQGDAAGTDPEVQVVMDADKTVTAVFVEQGTEPATITVETTGNGTVAIETEGPYEVGQEVTVLATPNPGSEFDHWEGDVAGTDNPLTFIIPDPDVLVRAVFVPSADRWLLTILLSEFGVVNLDPLPDPGDGLYPNNQEVTLTVVPNLGYEFDHWEGDLDGTANPATLTMDGNKGVTAMYRPIGRWTLTTHVAPAAGGAIVADPAGDPPGSYLNGTDVGLTANAADGYVFNGWSGDLTGMDNPATLTMDANKDVTASFLLDHPVANTITPNWAWLFGGVIARVDGDGFDPANTQVLIAGNQPATVLNVTPTSVVFVVPPLEEVGTGLEATREVDVVVRVGILDAAIRFTYKRYETLDGVTTTAFMFDGDKADTTVAVALDDGLGFNNGGADLLLPTPTTPATLPEQVYGLTRASKDPADVLSDEIDAGAGSQAVANAWDFAVHLYYNTQPIGGQYDANAVGDPIYTEIHNWAYARSNDADAAELKFPVDDTALKIANMQAGVQYWSIDTAFEYTTGQTVPGNGVSVYQSTVLADEFNPGVLADTTIQVDSVWPRMYDLSAFSLRTGVGALPPVVTNGVVRDPGTAGEGDVAGGTPVSILCPNGGFGWVTVVFGQLDATKASLPSSNFAQATVLNPGQNEFLIQVQTPKYAKAETVDIGIYLNSNTANPVVVLKDAFKYTSDEKKCQWWWLALLGLGALAVGVAASSDHGGGGGGTCFIATAAYGTPLAAEIDTLRAVRDTFLLDNAAGTAFVDTYYRVSPAIADAVAQYPALAAVVRMVLMPIVVVSKLVLAMPLLSAALAMLLVAASMMRRRHSRVR